MSHLFSLKAVRQLYFVLLPCILIGGIFSSVRANAGILFEPSVGYEYDTFNANFSAGSNVAYSVTGPSLGLAVGYSFLIFYADVDYQYGMLNSSVTSQPSGLSYTGASLIRNSLFIDAGVHIPMLRAYVGYSPLNNWDFKANSMGSNNVTFLGSGLKVGASFTGLPFIAINLEYMMSTFSSYTDSSNHSMGSSSTYSDASAKSIMLSVSLPLDL